jgi:hypothetical protein
MFKLETLIALIVDFIRTLLIEAASDRVRGLRPRRRLRGMKDVRRHVHRATRRRLLHRLSPEVRR